jgi:hypothetical protein
MFLRKNRKRFAGEIYEYWTLCQTVLTLRLCTVAKPDADVALLLAYLGLHLPKGSKLVQNVVEKNT